MASEIDPGPLRLPTLRFASMRPRRDGLGNLDHAVREHDGRAAASMRPRRDGLGNEDHVPAGIGERKGFNEAEARWPRKYGDAGWHRPILRHASMRPRRDGLGNYLSSDAPIRQSARFNEAEARWPRKCMTRKKTARNADELQ